MSIKPPCNCKPTNVNNYAFAKGDDSFPTGPGIGSEQMRPSRVYSLVTNIPNIFRQEAPAYSLQWISSASSADPRIQRTPYKKADKRAQAVVKKRVRM
jgi:hypothetical protein